MRSLSLAALAGLIALGAALAPASARDGVAATVEAAVWRSLADPALLYLSTRAEGGRWRTVNEPLDLSAPDPSGRFRRSNAVAVAVPLTDGGAATVEVAVWRSLADPSLLYLGTRAEGGSWRRGSEPLDLSVAGPSGRFRRSAIVAVRVPLPFIAPRPDPRLMEACANGVAVPDPEANPGLVGDCALLLEAHDILVGDGAPLNWSADTPMRDWRGIAVEGSPPRVTDVALVSYGIDLRGRVPSVLAGLSHLREIWISSALTGSIPPELGQLRNLQDLWLYGNQLTGPIPPELGSILALYDLRLGGNRLTGAIPPELGRLENLGYLQLDANQLTGGIPPELGALTRLWSLELDGNQLTGAIPPELARLPLLQTLELQGNRLTGTVPAEFASFGNLRELNLRDNRLTGQIPAKLSASPHFYRLWLGGNRFTGCLPLDLREVAQDRGALGLRFCQCPASLLPGDGEASTRTVGADGIPFLPDGYDEYTTATGTQRVSYSLVVDLPDGGAWRLGRRWRTDDGDIRARVWEEASQSYVVIDPFTGEEHGRVAVDGPADCAASPSALLDRIVASARAQPLAVPPDPDGARPMPFLEPVVGDGGSWRVPERGFSGDVRDGVSLVFDVPEGMRLTLESIAHVINGSPTTLVDLRDEASGSQMTLFAWTTYYASIGEEWRRNVTEAGKARGVDALFDRIAASAREGPPPSCDMPAIAPDCAILLGAKAALAGDAALNWSLGVPLEDWDGIVVDRRTVRIVWLDLRNAGLTGSIPPSLGGLSRLDALSLNGNRLTGAIPPEIAAIPGLRFLHLEHNLLTGAIPPELAAVPGLRLDLSGNRLEGCIPAGLYDIGTYGVPDSNPDLRRCDGSGPPTCARPETAPDCAVLLEARDILVGDGVPLGWSADVPLADWQGVTVDGETGRVVSLALEGAGLTGSIPPALGQLTGLEWLWLNNNSLGGKIPAEIGALANLRELYLSDNRLAGRIPSDLGHLVNLEILWIKNNQISGSIPPELSLLSNIKELSLSNNILTGEIPSLLGNLTKMEILWLNDNRIEGEIPSEIGNLQNLKEIYLFDNQITGRIPSELGQIKTLERLVLGRNGLTGPIPSELRTLTNLKTLSLSVNRLNGAIPSWLASLPKLQFLQLDNNRFEGCIPSKLERLKILSFSGNSHLRRAAPHCAALLRARDTLAGDAALNWDVNIPLTDWQGVTVNQIGGVDGLNLAGLGLTGQIPPELGEIKSLRVLDLSRNRLTGSIPPTIGRLMDVHTLDLSRNRLTGPIPPELARIWSLRFLRLQSNHLTGPIPPTLGQLAYLQEVQLDHNDLTGEIPSSFAQTRYLRRLDLSGNRLEGCIPTGLERFDILSHHGNPGLRRCGGAR